MTAPRRRPHVIERALRRIIRPNLPVEDVVRAGFEAILQRPPDDTTVAELAHAVLADPASLTLVLERMLASPEARVVGTPRLLREIAGLTPEMQFIALGTHCFASDFLKRWQAKQWSGPFDWIFSSIPMVTHCLEDDFRVFLDRTHYEPVPLAARLHPSVNRVEHRHYRDHFGVTSVFNHHDVHLDEDYAYLCRCVDRLRASLAGEDRKTFVLASAHTPHLLGQLFRLREVLQGRTRNFKLVAFLVDAPARICTEVEASHADETLQVYRVSPLSEWLPLRFADPTDELCLARLIAEAHRGTSG